MYCEISEKREDKHVALDFLLPTARSCLVSEGIILCQRSVSLLRKFVMEVCVGWLFHVALIMHVAFVMSRTFPLFILFGTVSRIFSTHYENVAAMRLRYCLRGIRP